jgi:ankyrin repeat protein
MLSLRGNIENLDQYCNDNNLAAVVRSIGYRNNYNPTIRTDEYVISLGLNNALDYVCEQRNMNVIRFLLKNKATVGNYCLEKIIKNNYTDVLGLLLEYKSIDVEYGLLYASRCDNLDIVKLMVDNGAVKFNESFTEACSYGNTRTAIFLVNAGATRLGPGINRCCDWSSHVEIIKFIIKKNRYYFNECVYYACMSGNTKVLQAIMDCGPVNYNELQYMNMILHFTIKHKHSYSSKINAILINNGVTNFNMFYDYKERPYQIITLLQHGTDIHRLSSIRNYDLLINDIRLFKQKIKSSLTTYLVDTIISIINSYAVL